MSHAQVFEDHEDVLRSIERVQRFLDETYLSGEETCNPDNWTMGCAGCQAKQITLLLDMVAREVQDDMVRPGLVAPETPKQG